MPIVTKEKLVALAVAWRWRAVPLALLACLANVAAPLDAAESCLVRLERLTKFLSPDAENPWRAAAFPRANGPVDAPALARAIGVRPSDLHVQSLEAFCRDHVCRRGSDPVDVQRERQWMELERILTRELRGTRAFYVRAPRVAIYVIGRDPHAGGWVGIKGWQYDWPGGAEQAPSEETP